MIQILLADDHHLFREGLKKLFAIAPEIVVGGEATNGGEVLNALRRDSFDLVLLDLTMPGISGVDLIARIAAQDNAPPILILSMHNEALIVRHSLAAGASGYLSKDCAPENLLAAIRKVAAGGRFLDPGLAETIAFGPNSAMPLPDHGQLSGREFQILCALARGCSVNEIAAQLAISNKTVSTHKARMMNKMGFINNVDLVRYSLTHDLLHLPQKRQA